jgi:uncharacterized protein (DUF58 family)
LTRAQLALVGFQTSPATSAIASGWPSLLKSFVAATVIIFIRWEVDESPRIDVSRSLTRTNLSKTDLGGKAGTPEGN